MFVLSKKNPNKQYSVIFFLTNIFIIKVNSKKFLIYLLKLINPFKCSYRT